MTLGELNSKLEGGAETQTFEVKDACDWNVVSLAKDILAMSNVQYGGDIIIGIEDGSFERKGINANQKATYNIDIMKDQLAPYADPHVNFKVNFITDKIGMEYAVITVFPFNEIPVICRKDCKDTKAGSIYYRNNNGRVQSARVSNSYDMRDIITNATVKMMEKINKAGLTVKGATSIEDILNDELEGL